MKSYATALMNRGTQTHCRPCSPAKVGWWGRLFAALLFTFYVGFIPVHLATETHLGDLPASVDDADLHHDGHDDGDHDADSGHHTPHRASDHTLILTAPEKSPNVPALAVLFLPALVSVFVNEPEPQPKAPVFERIRLPGESPPGPLQPRAPPLP